MKKENLENQALYIISQISFFHSNICHNKRPIKNFSQVSVKLFYKLDIQRNLDSGRGDTETALHVITWAAQTEEFPCGVM